MKTVVIDLVVPTKQPAQIRDDTPHDVQTIHNPMETIDQITPIWEFPDAEPVEETQDKDAVPADEVPGRDLLDISGNLSRTPSIHTPHLKPTHRSQEATTNPLRTNAPAPSTQQAHTLSIDDDQPTENQSPRRVPTPVSVDTILELDIADGGPTAIETSTVMEKSCSAAHHAREGNEIHANLEATPSTLQVRPDITNDNHRGSPPEDAYSTHESTLCKNTLITQNPEHSDETSLPAESFLSGHAVSTILDHDIKDTTLSEDITIPVPHVDALTPQGPPATSSNQADEVKGPTNGDHPGKTEKTISNAFPEAHTCLDITSSQSDPIVQSTREQDHNIPIKTDLLGHTKIVPLMLSASEVVIEIADCRLMPGSAEISQPSLLHENTATPTPQRNVRRISLESVNDESTQPHTLQSTPVGNHVRLVETPFPDTSRDNSGSRLEFRGFQPTYFIRH